MKNARRFLAASVLLLAAAASASEGPVEHYLRGLLEERFGKVQNAADEYEKAVKLDPAARFVHEALAAVDLRIGQTDKALREAETVVSLSTSTPHSYLVLGRVRLARGEVALANDAFNRALELDPNDDEALLYSAHIRLATQPGEALSLYNRFIENNPESLEARARAAELHQRLGNLNAAADGWKKILEIDPGDFSAHLALANLYEIQRDTAAALGEYESCRFLDPENVGILLRLGELYYRFDRGDQAREAFEQAFRQAPKDASVNFWLALLAEERKDWPEATTRMEIVAAQNADAAVLLRLAYYQSQSGNPRRAMVTLKKILKQDPDNPDFLYYSALGYEDVGKPRTAIKMLQRVVEKDPTRAEAEFHLAADYDAVGKPDEAERHLLRTLELNPSHAIALNYLAYSWAERGKDLVRALEYVKRALALEPENGAFLDSLGWIYFKLGRYVEAETAMSQAVSRVNDPTVWDHYGQVLEKLGKLPEARRAWQEGLMLDPKNKALQKRVKSVGGRVEPMTGSRRLLKNVEGNFRQLSSVTGFMKLGGRDHERFFDAQGMFYYSKPQRFRLEVLGPFLVPAMLVVQDGTAVSARAASGDSWEPRPEWLGLLGDFLSGELMRRFDDPAVRVEQKGERLSYLSAFGQLDVDTKRRVATRFVWADPGVFKGLAEFRLAGYRDVEGLWLPSEVECDIPGEHFKVSLTLSRVKVNASLDAALFRLNAQP